MTPDAASPPRWWTVDEARRWIVHRDPNRPLAIEAPYQNGAPVNTGDMTPARAEIEAAGRALQRAIADERVAARGIRTLGADPEPIPPATMANPAVTLSLAGNFIGPDSRVAGWERVPLPLFRQVEVDRAEVVNLWHARPPGAEEAAAWLRENMAAAHYKVAMPAVRKALKVPETVARAGWRLAGLTRGPGRRRSPER